MNKNYLRGSRKEYLAKKQLEEKGFFVIRSAGSHGVADLCAIASERVILLQIKTTKKALTSNFAEARYSEDIESLRSVTKIPSNCEKQLWVFLDRKGWTKYKVTDSDLIEFERVY